MEEPFYQYFQVFMEEYNGEDTDRIYEAEEAFYDALDEYAELANNVPDDLFDYIDQIASFVNADQDDMITDLAGLTDFRSFRDFFDNYENVEDLGHFALVYDEAKIVFRFNRTVDYVTCYSPISKQLFLVQVNDGLIDLLNGNDDGELDDTSFAFYRYLDLCAGGHQLYDDSTEYISSATCTTPGELVNISKCEVCSQLPTTEVAGL